MQVTIAATSSHLDNDTVLIEVTTTIGDSKSVQRCGYSVFELEQNRYMAGTLEERIEKLRQSAQDAAEHSFKAQYAALLAYQAGTQPAVLEVVEETTEAPTEEPVKKARAKRTTKQATEATEQE